VAAPTPAFNSKRLQNHAGWCCDTKFNYTNSSHAIQVQQFL